MDNASHFKCIPEEFFDENDSVYEDYLDCLTTLENVQKPCDRFTEYILNEWKKDFDKETE